MRRITVTLVLGEILVLMLPCLQADIVDCGGFRSLSVGDTGTISSPNYPNDYPNNTKCIWRFEAPISHHIQLTAATVAGERDAGGTCRDYIQLRDLSRDGDLIEEAICDVGFTYSSPGRWLWIMFRSSTNNSYSGFQATYTTLAANANSTSAINSVPSPVRNCRTHEFECANFECLPYSYRCDGDNDCGCLYGCDEDGCGGTDLGRGEMLGIGIACGLVMFAIMFILVTILDRKHHNIFFKKINDKKELSSRRTSRANSTLSSVFAQSLSAHRANSTVA